jgi:calcineurin-like phosphoesterase family protein
MIEQLYEPFRHWGERGSVFVISDTHFHDADCAVMDPNWIAPEEHAEILRKAIHRCDTVIHLGDVGDLAVWDAIWKPGKRPHEVLVTGNHDVGVEELREHFDEVFTGPVFVAEKLVLSHEPIQGLDWCMNLHGHDHCPRHRGDAHHVNLAANVVGFVPLNLGHAIKGGLLAKQCGIHRVTINGATERKRARNRNRV